MENWCRWVMCGLATVGGLGLLIFLIIFMRGSSGATAEISGDNNEVENSSNQEISIFHWTSLSERMENEQQVQSYHNKTKYFLILVIFIGLAVTLVYKCVTHKGKKRKKRRMTQDLDLIELHHDSLAKHGILKNNQLTTWRRDEIEKTREVKEKSRKQEQKEKKGKKKQGIEEEEDARMQKPGAGAGAGIEAEEGDLCLEQKPRFSSKGKKWIQIDCSDED